MSISERSRNEFNRLFSPDLDAVAGFLANHGLPEDVFPDAVLRQWAATRGFVHASTRSASASTPSSNDPGPEDEIRVFDCCGEFGYSIPWAQWKTREVPIVPTRSTKRRFVYLWGPASAPPETFRDEFPNCLGTLGVAWYSNPDGSVQWGSVANALSNYARAFLSGPPQGSGRHAKPEAATTEAKLPDAVAGCLGADGRRVRLVGNDPVAELCFDIRSAEPQVQTLLAEFGAGRFGFLAMNLAACSTVLELLDRATAAINADLGSTEPRDPNAVEADRQLVSVAPQLRGLVAHCLDVMKTEREKRRAADPSAAFSNMIRSILGSGGQN